MKTRYAVLALALLAGCPNQARNESIKSANEGSKALGAKQFDTAITAFKKATDGFHDNHLAWYGLGAAYAQRQEWPAAVDAFTTAAQIEPDQPMYQMWLGIAMYEKQVKVAREEEAHKQNKKVEEVQADLGSIDFGQAQQHLAKAVELNKDMWRAHYYLGKIYRAQDKPKDAATELTAAITANPREAGPYVALGEIYRRWDYSDAAISVAQQGINNVPGDTDKSDIYYVLGMGYDDKANESEAIKAFTEALKRKRDNHLAQFQRGQAYFRTQDFSDAKTDLEAFQKSGGASVEFAKSQATKMLMQMTAAQNAKDHAGDKKPTPEEATKKGGFQPPKR
jgi:tetratricopeptide (TPR) repeat protein|nr:tetratricopeptide repeat protein [Kofleriaceae bacterium]